jgi:hypothetical protein
MGCTNIELFTVQVLFFHFAYANNEFFPLVFSYYALIHVSSVIIFMKYDDVCLYLSVDFIHFFGQSS